MCVCLNVCTQPCGSLCLGQSPLLRPQEGGPEPHDSEFSHWNSSAFAELVNKNSRLSHICLHGHVAASALGPLLTHPVGKCLLSICCVRDSGLGAADTTVSMTMALSLCLPMGMVSRLRYITGKFQRAMVCQRK